MFEFELEHIMRRHGSPDLKISSCPILLRVTVEGETTCELQKDLAWHFREAKPGFTVLFDRDMVKEQKCSSA